MSATRGLSPADFLFGATIGEGSYSRVIHARLKCSSSPSKKQSSSSRMVSLPERNYSIKVMDKVDIMKKNKVDRVMKEKKILACLKSNLIVKLHGSFQCKDNLYLVLDFCTGGELKHMIEYFRNKHKHGIVSSICCDIECIKYYTGQIIRSIEYLHVMGVVHRDLKPENILLTADGRIKLADFGAALDTRNVTSVAYNRTKKSPRTSHMIEEDSFVGTAEYVSPEILNGDKVTGSVDLWALGCIIFQMLTGNPPFHGPNDYLIFHSIMEHAKREKALVFPEYVPKNGINLIDKLLVLNPMMRLGAKDINVENSEFTYISIRRHAFFEGFCWDRLDDDTMNPPYLPQLPKWLKSTTTGEIPMRDGAKGIDDWILDKEATPVYEMATVCSKKQVDGGDDTDDGEKKCEHEERKIMP